jgi:RNA polymerase sigma-70 factor, ECF subfamily
MSKYLSLLFTKDFNALPPNVQQEVYREYYKMVYPIIYYIVKDYQATEDIIHEAFLRTIDKSQQLNHIGSVDSWLKMVARNVSLNFLRKLKRNRNELDNDSVFTNKEPPEHLIYSVLEEEVEAKVLREDIVKYMNMLKPEYRQMIEMRWGSNHSYKEIAEAMGTTESIVRQKLYRARESVKQKLHEEWGLY